jgi:hypothetical protein
VDLSPISFWIGFVCMRLAHTWACVSLLVEFDENYDGNIAFRSCVI